MTKKPRNCDRQYQKQRSNYRRGIRNSYDKKIQTMKPFVPCQPAYYQNPDKPQWLKGQIQSRTGDRTYTVTGADSAVYTRNRVNLRERHTTDMHEPTKDPILPPADRPTEPS